MGEVLVILGVEAQLSRPYHCKNGFEVAGIMGRSGFMSELTIGRYEIRGELGEGGMGRFIVLLTQPWGVRLR